MEIIASSKIEDFYSDVNIPILLVTEERLLRVLR